MQSDAKSPGAVIGGNLRSLREQHGKRQDDIAAAARAVGLRWSQATVGAIETGRREVSVGELIALPSILLRSLDLAVTITVQDLVTTEEDLRLGHDFTAAPAWVAAAFRRRRRLTAEERAHTQAAIAEAEVEFARLDAEAQVKAAQVDAGQLLERRAAQRLGVDPLAVALAARKTWGHSLTAERDRRTEGGSAKPRGVGAVTRQCIAELRPVLAHAGLITED